MTVIPAMVLVHSPSLGPATWVPCARILQAQGVDAVVPDLRHIGSGGPPYWPRVAAAVGEAMGQLDDPGPVALVAHSNAGLFVPTVAEASPRPVEVVVFVDAAVPEPPDPAPVADDDVVRWLRALVEPDGRLPRWSDWWSEEEMAAVLPDADVRRRVIEDQPRLPLDYYGQTLPIPRGWPPERGAYLQFTPFYDGDAARARAAGWPVERIAGEHLHQVVEPATVVDAILRLVARAEGA